MTAWKLRAVSASSMGLTPLAGLPGATRGGSVDPRSVHAFNLYARSRRLICCAALSSTSPPMLAGPVRAAQRTCTLRPYDEACPLPLPQESPPDTNHTPQAEDILNKKSGWKALTGTTNFGEIVSQATTPASQPLSSSEEEKQFQSQCRLAYAIFVDRVAAFVGSYFVALQGHVDALVFAGGIGESSAALRSAVLEKVACLGFTLDEAKNDGACPGATGSKSCGGSDVDDARSAVADITSDTRDHRSMKTLACWTDEQVRGSGLYGLFSCSHLPVLLVSLLASLRRRISGI